MKQKKFQESIETFKRLLKLSPSLPSIVSLGEAFLAIGDTGQALYYLNKAALDAPKSGRIMGLIADVFAASNQTGKSYFAYLKSASMIKTPESLQPKISQCETDLNLRKNRQGKTPLAS